MRTHHIGVANANFVTDRLAVGGDLDQYNSQLAVCQAVDLVHTGYITHILDVRQECHDLATFVDLELPVVYKWAGIDDIGQRVPAAWFEDVVTWALEVLEDPDARLLAHCHMGINRGPSAGYAVMLGLGWDPVEAIAAIREARPIANVWYAEDALRWRFESDPVRLQRETERLRQWREENPLDVVRIIAQKRAEGQ